MKNDRKAAAVERFDALLRARHFTDAARLIVGQIEERAADRGMFFGQLTEATAAMLAVLSILRWERKVGLAALERTGADLDRLARDLDDAIRAEGRCRPTEGPYWICGPSGQKGVVWDPDTPRRSLLDQAASEAAALGHNWTGTEHLLMAAIQLACPVFREVLDRHGINYDPVRQKVLNVLNNDG
jgi:hypothetical protein